MGDLLICTAYSKNYFNILKIVAVQVMPTLNQISGSSINNIKLEEI